LFSASWTYKAFFSGLPDTLIYGLKNFLAQKSVYDKHVWNPFQFLAFSFYV